MRLAALVLTAAILTSVAGTADGDSAPLVTNSLFSKECGACHMAYPPTLLPAVSWRKIVATLDDHFGENASLDKETRDKIEAYLVANAGRGRVDPANPPLRITDLNWFRREHSGGEAESLRQARDVKTMADCAACHRGAGDDDDDD